MGSASAEAARKYEGILWTGVKEEEERGRKEGWYHGNFLLLGAGEGGTSQGVKQTSFGRERGEGRRKQIEGFLRLVFSSPCLPHFFSSVGFAMSLVKQKEACLHR